MANFSTQKVVSVLPDPLTPDTLYLVRVGDGFDFYCSDTTGSIAHKINASDLDPSQFATTAQGALADTALQPESIGVTVQGYSLNTVIDADYSTVKSTALSATQPGDLSAVATTGAYADLSGLPTLGTAAATASTDYATAAQGALANTATQPGDNISTLTNDAGYLTDNTIGIVFDGGTSSTTYYPITIDLGGVS